LSVILKTDGLRLCVKYVCIDRLKSVIILALASASIRACFFLYTLRRRTTANPIIMRRAAVVTVNIVLLL
jgi:hypothetical protein